MRFAITGVDLYQGVLLELLNAGWQPVKLFSWPTDNIFDFNRNILSYALELKIPIQLSRMTPRDLADLKSMGCEVLIAAGYNWRIPSWEEHIPYAINFHCSLLPEARGAWPLPSAILKGYQNWGSTVHKISDDFDAGEILAQTQYPLSADETHSSLVLKSQMAHRRLAQVISRDFENLWRDAKPQATGGSYWPRFTDEDRTLSWHKTVAENMRIVRAFDTLEVIAHLNDNTLFVRKASGWQEMHTMQPGTIAHTYDRELVVAVTDGFMALHAYSPIAVENTELLGRW